MTGELFDLLCIKSVLADSVEKDDASFNAISFLRGVNDSGGSDFLNIIFHVRTNILFKKCSKNENYHYLSGLLIGEELKTIAAGNYAAVTIVSAGNLRTLYAEALSALGYTPLIKNAEDALIRGQATIYNHYI